MAAGYRYSYCDLPIHQAREEQVTGLDESIDLGRQVGDLTIDLSRVILKLPQKGV